MKVRILTGRTHQIRVHLASVGIPVLGDATYGGVLSALPEIERQMLHAWKLQLPHPVTGEKIEFCAPLPDDFQTTLNDFNFFPVPVLKSFAVMLFYLYVSGQQITVL